MKNFLLMIIRRMIAENNSATPTEVMIKIIHAGRGWVIPTKVYVMKECWDCIEERITPQDKDMDIKNDRIDEMCRRVVGKIQYFLDKILADNLQFLLNSVSLYDIPKPSVSFYDLIQRKIKTTRTLNTRRNYECFARYFSNKIGKGPSTELIDQKFVDETIEMINRNYEGHDAMKFLMISKFKTILKLGQDSRLINHPVNIIPLKRGNYSKPKSLTEIEIRHIFATYRECLLSDPQIRNKGTMAVGLFILDIALQGLAPVDLAELRVDSIKPRKIDISDNTLLTGMTHNDEKDHTIDGFTISTQRRKTGNPVFIVSSLYGLEALMNKLTAGKNKEDYLCECFNTSLILNETQRQNRLANYFNMHSRQLNTELRDYYRRHGLGTPKKISYYWARHAFCDIVDSMDIPRHIIQHLIGHRTSVLETNYLRRLTLEEQAAISHSILCKYL